MKHYAVKVVHSGIYRGRLRRQRVRANRDCRLHVFDDEIGVEVAFGLCGDGSHHVLVYLTDGAAHCHPPVPLGEFAAADVLEMHQALHRTAMQAKIDMALRAMPLGREDAKSWSHEARAFLLCTLRLIPRLPIDKWVEMR